MPSTPLRVAIVDDNPRFRATMEKFVQVLPGFSFSAAFGTAGEALDLVERGIANTGTPPWDLVLMDLELPRISGIDATRRMKALAPGLFVVVLTVFEDPATILEAIAAGADGYLVKRSSAPQLRTQLNAIVQDGAPMTPGVARTVLAFVRERTTAAHTGGTATRLNLTSREQDVLRCIVRGRSYQQTADDLGVGIETVRSHVRNLYRKLQVRNVAEAVALAIRKKLI